MSSVRYNAKLSSRIAEELRNIIFEKNLTSGDPFYTEREIVEKWSCSRATAREALLLLEFEGLINTKPGIGGGVFISEPDPRSLIRSFHTSINFNNITTSELADVRIAIESLCAELAAIKSTEEDQKYIYDIMIDLEEDLLNYKDSASIKNVEFHLSIAKASHNRVLILLMKVLETLVFEDSRRFEYTDEEIKQIIAIHRKIYEAIVKRKPDEASRLMRKHIEAYKKTVLKQ